jgi:putative transposase
LLTTTNNLLNDSKRAVYVVLGINRKGNKALLGLWIGEAESEGG